MSSPARSARLSCALALSLAGALPAFALDVRVDPALGPLFAESVREAARRLEEPGCAVLLDEMLDTRTGAPLSASVRATGLGASELLRSLLFRDGTGLEPCRDRKTAAFTSPGNRVVFVCPSAFRGNRAPRGVAAWTVALHESLHSLGLGEDPPTSWEITVRVRQACDR